MKSDSSSNFIIYAVEIAMAILLLFFIFSLSRRAAAITAGSKDSSASAQTRFFPNSARSQTSSNTHFGQRPVIVLDSGHGGFDPGKIGIDGSLEKDINLQIARRVRQYLTAADVDVVMTRDSDTSLYGPNDNNKKIADMRNRCQLINEANPALVVSIHQNSYHEESVDGAQVFYYQNSENGKRLAEILQRRFDYVLGDANTRTARANDSYYLLLHVKSPIVIVECGFLSNRAEAENLSTEEYQDKVAWTIHMGIMEYLNTL